MRLLDAFCVTMAGALVLALAGALLFGLYEKGGWPAAVFGLGLFIMFPVCIRGFGVLLGYGEEVKK
jgi:hypothetical protein